MIKRIFDIIFSFLGIIILIPFFSLLAILIIFDSGFPVFYIQKRVGKNGTDFFLLKFRTMKADADKQGLLTIGEKDLRITNIGYFLRKHKIDELPQLFNVFTGSMSLVGPRPEVRKYVEMYNTEQRKALSVKPGITDYASIKYSKENVILSKAQHPEQLYIQEIMPAKLKLNLAYIKTQSFCADLKIIFKTIRRIIA